MHPGAAATDPIDPQGGGANPEPVRQQEAALVTVGLSGAHKVQDFKCSKSERVNGFFNNEARLLVPNYCRVFIAPNPDDETAVWGFYTLSAALLLKQNLSGSDERRIAKSYLGYPAPMVRIGFMGRHDGAPQGLGAALIVDAARRVYRNADIAAWGLVLEPEGGKKKEKLWSWYLSQGFKECRALSNTESMYAPLSAFLPELQV